MHECEPRTWFESIELLNRRYTPHFFVEFEFYKSWFSALSLERNRRGFYSRCISFFPFFLLITLAGWVGVAVIIIIIIRVNKLSHSLSPSLGLTRPCARPTSLSRACNVSRWSAFCLWYYRLCRLAIITNSIRFIFFIRSVWICFVRWRWQYKRATRTPGSENYYIWRTRIPTNTFENNLLNRLSLAAAVSFACKCVVWSLGAIVNTDIAAVAAAAVEWGAHLIFVCSLV